MAAGPHTEVVGVIMAGGQGLRMQTSGESTPKPLVALLGAALVERNVMSALRCGVTDVRVVLAAGAPGAEIARWCVSRGSALVGAVGGRLAVVEEHDPLGNCGGLALAMGDEPMDAVMLFADNLTDLDLDAIVGAHREQQAALTLAVHDEPFRLPYGVVETDEGGSGRVTAYREKPTIPVSVSSGVAVVSESARRLLAGPAGLADLANGCVEAGLPIVTFRHSSRWIDVNDKSKVVAAEAIIASAPDAFEQFWHPDLQVLPVGDQDGIRIDDLDASGRPARISTGLMSPEAVSAEAWRRVRAWQSRAGDLEAD